MTGTEVGCVAAVAASALAYFGTLELLARLDVSWYLPFWAHALLLLAVYLVVFVVGRAALT